MYEQTLTAAGLEPDQALIYETLLHAGPMKAGDISFKSGIKRGLTYKILDELTSLGLVSKAEAKVAVFEPTHPAKLKEFSEKQEAKIRTAQLALDGIIGQLVSDYNLSLGKPGVRFYEGKEGIKKVLEDNLDSKTEIYGYFDVAAIMKYIPDINLEYVKKRERRNLKKRGIYLDTPDNRKYLQGYHTSITSNRFLSAESLPFESIMQIYDGKISYVTLRPDKMFGVIINDQLIYNMHKILFEALWSYLKP
jgi:HTH-type transcriptional regulator, sugar sensing transcriptional regulator